MDFLLLLIIRNNFNESYHKFVIIYKKLEIIIMIHGFLIIYQ